MGSMSPYIAPWILWVSVFVQRNVSFSLMAPLEATIFPQDHIMDQFDGEMLEPAAPSSDRISQKLSYSSLKMYGKTSTKTHIFLCSKGRF